METLTSLAMIAVIVVAVLLIAVLVYILRVLNEVKVIFGLLKNGKKFLKELTRSKD